MELPIAKKLRVRIHQIRPFSHKNSGRRNIQESKKTDKMTNKNRYNKERDGLQQGIYAVINPFVKLLIRMGVTPNMVTTHRLRTTDPVFCL